MFSLGFLGKLSNDGHLQMATWPWDPEQACDTAPGGQAGLGHPGVIPGSEEGGGSTNTRNSRIDT